MAATPAYEKAWQFAVNRTINVQPSNNQIQAELFLSIKNAWKGFTTQPWTVVGSNDTAAQALDGVDRLLAHGNIVTNAWIVLRQPGTGIQVCFFFTANATAMTVVMSPAAGFTGGGLGARPTATDEIVIINAVQWCSDLTNLRVHAHVGHSTDGKHTYVFATTRSCVVSIWYFGAVTDPVAPWTLPFIGGVVSGSGINFGLHEIVPFFQATTLKARGPSGLMNMTVGLEGSNDVLSRQMDYNESSIDGRWPMFRCFLLSETATMQGVHGVMTDFRRVTYGIPVGFQFRGNGATWISFGGWTVPWPDDTAARTV